MNIARLGPLFLLATYLFGCTRLPQDREQLVNNLVESRIGQQAYWNREGDQDPRLQAYIQEMLCAPITAHSAIQIALLNNPQIQATFEDVGIAQADLIEAGLLSNPAFEVEVRYPQERRLRTNIEYLITAAFLDAFLIPLRTRLAATELEQATLRVANAILTLSFEVRQTFYELIAQQQKLKCTQAIVELTSIQGEIASRQRQAGNINSLDFQQAQAKLLAAHVEIAKLQADIIRLKERLNRQLGLSEEANLTILEELPEEKEDQGLDLCSLESVALKERLDLQIARFDVIRLRRLLGLKEWWTFSNLRAGLAGERDPDGVNLLGYGLTGEVPIFNYGQAARMRLFAQLKQAQDRLAALEIQILSEVREAYQLLMNQWNTVIFYRSQLLPMQIKIVQSSEELYNVMGLGIDQLLEAKHIELDMCRSYQEALKDYWKAQIQLDYTLGGNLFRLLPGDSNE